MKNYPLILNKVKSSYWAATPSTVENIMKALDQHMAGITPEDYDVEDDDISIETEKSPIAIIPVFGIIGKHLSMLESMCGGIDVDMIRREIERYVADPEVTDIVLYFNSPGGTVTGVPELSNYIYEASKVKNIISYTESMMCSAAYWIASQTNAIYSSPSSEVGSIGVYSLIVDETMALQQQGINVIPISAGKYKLMGASFIKMNEEEKNMMQEGVNKIYNQFKETVKRKRDVDEECMQGQTFDGEECSNNNLTDGSFDNLDELLNFLYSVKQ